MSTLVVSFARSDAWRDREFVATGKRPGFSANVKFDMATDADEAQRKAIAAHCAGKAWDSEVSISLVNPQPTGSEPLIELDAPPTLDEALDHLAKAQATRAAYDVERAAVAERKRQEAAERNRQEAERTAAAEAAKQQRHAEKIAWIAAHGSDRLRRAVERGHDCQALYIRERAAVEAAGFTADIYDGAAWKPATCPSVAALDAADAAETLNVGEVQIVWLTSPAIDVKARDGASWDGYMPHEDGLAIVIRGYLGRYDLVRAL